MTELGRIASWLVLRRWEAEDAVAAELAVAPVGIPEEELRRATGLRAARLRRALVDLQAREIVAHVTRVAAWSRGAPVRFYYLLERPLEPDDRQTRSTPGPAIGSDNAR